MTVRVTEEDRERARELYGFACTAADQDDAHLDGIEVERLAHALATARAEGAEERWIPVGERMPEPTDPHDPGRYVLVVMVLEDIADLHVIDREFWYGPGADDGQNPWLEARGRITHWCELPDYPSLPSEPAGKP